MPSFIARLPGKLNYRLHVASATEESLVYVVVVVVGGRRGE
jgi:hypothetical protein